MNCPNCRHPIASSEVNVQKDIAHCSSCNHVFKISENIEAAEDDILLESFDPAVTPDGVHHEIKSDGVYISIKTGSAKTAFILIPFTLAWSGFSLGMLYGRQILSGEFDLVMSIFGLPFLAGSILLIGVVLNSLAGRATLHLTNSGGTYFHGVGTLGIKKKWRWEETVQIIDTISTVRYPGSGTRAIKIEGPSRISVGSAIKDDKVDYFYYALRYYFDQYKRKKYIY
ncbi:hypothetical protein [Parvicella tangerina]|uniref:Uncharacterized protein n=1 Tax=Parvicella tangerina TaxID=2829795 RepID=A0A916NBD8_9FLAO|nr:hypothetical protein [Parvicella tangerina]CAG5082907.1 hypothetical protein CRYO30217_02040 [Parvicella tangerina]